MSAAAKIPAHMSAAEFLAWAPRDGRRWQLVDGEPQAMAPANRTHGALQSELVRRLGNHFMERRSPCSVVSQGGVVPRLRANYNVRIPDLLVTCTGYETEEATPTDPVLIVEILSNSNEAETWANVWTYTTIPSVQEILILRTAAVGAELLRRRPDRSWPDDPETVVDGEITLECVGFRVGLRDLYATTRHALPR